MSRRWPRALLWVLVAVTIAGCGQSADERAVRKAVDRWTGAIAAHDSDAACATLSARLHASIERHLLGEGVTGSCRTWAARYINPRHPAAQPDVRIAGVEINGKRATAHLAAPGAVTSDARLVNQDGRWLVDDY